MTTPEEKILILRDLSPDEQNHIKDTNSSIYSTQPLKENIDYQKINLETDFLSKNTKNCFDNVIKFGHKQLKDKKIIDCLTFENQTYWFYLRFSLYNFYQPIYSEEQVILKFLKDNTSESLTVYSKFKHEIPSCNFITPKKIKQKKPYKNYLSFILLFFARVFLGFWAHITTKKNTNIILQNPLNLNKIIDFDNPDSIILGETNHEYLCNKANKDDDFSFLSDIYPANFNNGLNFKSDFIKNKYSKKTFLLEFYIFLKIINPFFILKALKFKKELTKNINLRQANNLANEDLIILSYIKSKILLLSYIYLRENAAKLFLKAKKIKSISCYGEFNYNNYPIINAAKTLKIPTIGIQHGIIHPLHMHYVYSKLDKPYKPVLDYFIVWGEHWKNLMLEYSIFDKDNIFTIGQSRTDIIPILQNRKLKKKEKTIFFASQPMPMSKSLREEFAIGFFEIAKKFQNTNFIIKPHNGEKDAYEYYPEIAKKVGTENYSISKNDLYLTLNSCDVLITHNSTVASEALYFKKPVVLLDYLHDDLSNYLKYEGAFFKAANNNEFYTLIESVIDESLTIDTTLQDQFIFNFANIIDGNICTKYIEFIKSKNKKVLHT